jgi:hypothetical protein
MTPKEYEAKKIELAQRLAEQKVLSQNLQSKYHFENDEIIAQMNDLIDTQNKTLESLGQNLEEQLSTCETEYATLNWHNDHKHDQNDDDLNDDDEKYLEMITARLENFKNHVQSLKIEKSLMDKQKQDLQQEVNHSQKEVQILTKVTNALDQIILNQQKIAIDSLTSILTTGLKMMFGADVQVHITHKLSHNYFHFDIQTQMTNANGEIIRGNHDAFGGSLTTVESLLLRVITILKFKMRRILLLDEFFGSLDADRIEALRPLLSLLVKEYQFDILCVTHDDELAQLSNICYELQNLRQGVTFKKIVQKSSDTP